MNTGGVTTATNKRMDKDMAWEIKEESRTKTTVSGRDDSENLKC